MAFITLKVRKGRKNKLTDCIDNVIVEMKKKYEPHRDREGEAVVTRFDDIYKGVVLILIYGESKKVLVNGS